MKYGSMIKKARLSLGLIQADLSNSNISSSIVSDIEKDKIRLVPSKGLLIYEFLVMKSVEKDIDIDLDFDDLLSDFDQYNRIKKSKLIIDQLKSAIKDETVLPQTELEVLRLYAIRNDIGMLKYFIFRLIASQKNINDQYKMKVMYNLLDYLKWQPFEQISKFFDVSLSDLTALGFQYMKFKQLIEYYEYFEDNCRDYDIKIEVRIYYNMGLIYKELAEYKLAHKYIERYLDFTANISLEKKLKGLTTLGNIAMLQGNFELGISYYDRVYSLSHAEGCEKQQMIICNNLLYALVRMNNQNLDQLNEYYTKYMALAPIYLDELNKKYSAYLNVALAHDYLGDYDLALENLNTAISVSYSDVSKVTIINETYYLMKKVHVHWILENISMLDFDGLSEKNKNIILSIVLGIVISNNDSHDIATFVQKKLSQILEFSNI